MTRILLASLSPWIAAAVLAASPVRAADRVAEGLLAFYDFAEGGGRTVHDRSGASAALDLTIDNSRGVRWSKNSLSVRSSVLIASPQPARKIIDAVKRSGAITIEAWLRPPNITQTGPARIVSISADTGQRNTTLGQDKDFYDVRLRTTARSNNGIPSTPAPKRSLQPRLTHVAFTRDAKGTAIVYVDSKQVVRRRVEGRLTNWDGRYRLALANELTKDRPWLGELHLVALYGPRVVQQGSATEFRRGRLSQARPRGTRRRRSL